MINAPSIDDLTPNDLKRRERVNKATEVCSFNVWFDYPRALEILDLIDVKYMEAYRYYEDPINNVDVRPTSLYLSGEINTGKSTILTKYSSYCKQMAKIEGRIFSKYDILKYDTPVRVTFKRMFASILERFGKVIRGSALRSIHTDSLIEMIVDEFKKKKVKLLILDEIQNLLKSSKEDKDDIFTGFKQITNNSQTRIIFAGTPDAVDLLEDTKFIDERIGVLELPPWDTEEDGGELWQNLLFEVYQAYKDVIPDWDLVVYDEELKTETTNVDLAEDLHELSDGRLGKLLKTIKDAIVYALLRNKTNIDWEDYEAVQYFSFEMKDGKVKKQMRD